MLHTLCGLVCIRYGDKPDVRTVRCEYVKLACGRFLCVCWDYEKNAYRSFYSDMALVVA